jgi:hypothetical protein
VFQILQTTDGCSFFVALLPPFPVESNFHKPFIHTEIRTYMLLPNPFISVTNVRALLPQPIVDFPLEHQDIFIKENVYSKGGSAV